MGSAVESLPAVIYFKMILKFLLLTAISLQEKLLKLENPLIKKLLSTLVRIYLMKIDKLIEKNLEKLFFKIKSN